MDFLLYLALIPALGLTAQWIAWRTSLPGILLLLLFGLVLGMFQNPDQVLAELTGGDVSAGPRILFPLVSLSVAVIMFEGGLSLKFADLRESGSAALRLCTIGALVTFVGSSIAAHYTLGFGWRLACLLGAILVVTGPTVIGPLLRQVQPSRRVASALKWEGIVIDPIGAVLAVLVFDELMLNAGDSSIAAAAALLVKTALVGLILGAAGGALLTFGFRRFLVPDNLHGVASLSVALLIFAVANNRAHESGLIAVTVTGMWLTNQRHFDIEHIIEFKENLRTLLIGALFVVLGSRVDVADVAAIGMPGLAMLAILVIVIRPLSVFVSLFRSPLTFHEQCFVSGMAPRGIVAAAVSSVFALEMEHLGQGSAIEGSDQLATVTFFLIVGTVTVYGLCAFPLAKLLRLADSKRNGVLIAGADAWVVDFAKELHRANLPVLLVDSNFNKIAKARLAGLEAVCANILNEHAREELPVGGIGKMMAMTQNDEVNSLAVREARTMFDRAQLFQLTFNAANQHHRRGLTKNLMGRELFGQGLTFSELEARHELGAKFKSTRLSEEFTYDDFKNLYSDSAVALCVVDADSLIVHTVDRAFEPSAGQTVIALVGATTVPDDHAASPRGRSE